MEPKGGRANPALAERLRREGRRFEFAQAAVLLHRLWATGTEDHPFRYVGDRSLAYPSAELEVESLPEADPPARGRVRISFLGLTGMMGVLPPHYTELIEERRRQGDVAISRFFDIFQDRLVALFLGAHLRNRFWLRFAWLGGEPSAAGGRNRHPFQEMIFSLVGSATGDTRRRAGLPPLAQIHYGGLLAQQPRSPAAVAGIVSDYYGVPASVEGFRGDWVPIPEASWSRLGTERGGRLGLDLVAGDRYFDPGIGFRLRLGPMNLKLLQSLLPGTPGAETLDRFVRFAVGPDLKFETTLTLVADEVPAPRLTSDPDEPQRLGWTLWLRATDEPGDAVSGPFHSLPIDRPAAAAGRS